tara:strand:- start:472 stop:594 length:123 start_codon:yes stop_codon:yes gene_type:complete
MENNKTQQFARFYLKDLKAKTSKFQSEKPVYQELNNTSAS